MSVQQIIDAHCHIGDFGGVFIDEILSYLNPSQTIGIVGPSTSLAPSVFSRYKISILSGIKVTDPDIL